MSLDQHDATQPRISVLIAVRNGAKTIQRALDSVFEQTYPHVELIVIDGASTDGTQAILERNADRIAAWVSEPDRGIYHAMNKAVERATGDWLYFLGADDRFHSPWALANIASAIAADDGGHRIVYGSVNVVREDGSIRLYGFPWGETRRRFLRLGKMIPHQATFHHRTLFEQHGRFDERYRIAADYEFLLREVTDHEPLFVPEIIADMAGGGLSSRPSSEYRLQREIHRARHAHGLTRTPDWRSRRLYGTLLRIWIDRHLRRRNQVSGSTASGASPAGGGDAAE